MTFIAAVGQAQYTDAREAGMQAAYQALNGVGTITPVLGLLIVPHRYDPQQVINGAASILSNIPLIGFSVSSGLSKTGSHSQAVILALLAGDNFQAETHWFSAFNQSGTEAVSGINQLTGHEQRPVDYVMAFAEGLSDPADMDAFCANLPEGLPMLGCLSSGDLSGENSFQIAGMQSGTGNLSTAFLRGNLVIGSGYGHGWHPTGNRLVVTRSEGFKLIELDHKPSAEVYSQIFGQTMQAWTQPPLNTLSRIYPFGVEGQDAEDLIIHAPIRVNEDGSLRMNSRLREGSSAFLMVGSPADCLVAARQAAIKALGELGDSKPVFALVLVDNAWQVLLQAQPGHEIQVIQDVLGAGVPIAGGYTHGLIVPPAGKELNARFLNQHILVAVFGEKENPI